MLDLHLDPAVIKTLFSQRNILESGEILHKMVNNQSLSTKEISVLHSVYNVDKEILWQLPGDDVLAAAKNLVLSITDHLQEYLRYRNLTIASLKGVNYILVMKLVDWQKKRFTMFEVIEIHEKAKFFKIRARNCFETYSNCKRIIIRCRERN